MKNPARLFLGLVTMGVAVPGLVLLVWSRGENRTKSAPPPVSSVDAYFTKMSLKRERFEPSTDVRVDAFKPVRKDIEHQPERLWRVETPKLLPEATPRPLPKEPPGPLFKERPRPWFQERPESLPKAPPRPLYKKTPRPVRIEIPSAKSQPIKTGNSQQIQKGGFPQVENRNSPKESVQRLQDNVGRQKWWKDHVRKTCHSLQLDDASRALSPDMLQKIIVDDKNKLLYCQIPKVASTTWRRIFLQLTGKVDVKDFLSISANDVHHKYDDELTYLSDFTKDGISMRLRSYFKFVFVREPFERVLSAYKNKFDTKTKSAEYFKWKFGRKIVGKYRKPSLIPSNNTGGDVKFEEFVDYLVDDRKRIMMNEHWELFHKICHPCQIDYDFVGHLEKIEEDSQYILDSNSLSERIKVPNRRDSKYSYKKTNSFMKEYYSKLSPEVIGRLYEMYKADFLIFNYTIPAEISALM